MPTLTCEKAVKAKEFSDLSQEEQIYKLRYELQLAMRTISRTANELRLLQKHEHSVKGNVLIDVNDASKIFTPDRSEFLK